MYGKPSNIPEIYRPLSYDCRVWNIMASHNNDTVMVADVVDFFVFLIVCSVSARDFNAIEIH